MKPDGNHPGYRADIDGLRAIAVLAVVVFHAFPGQLRGGFVGVDVFFVISGYLISKIIIGSLAKDRFSLAEFYARRVKRIFPALAVVLGAWLVRALARRVHAARQARGRRRWVRLEPRAAE